MTPKEKPAPMTMRQCHAVYAPLIRRDRLIITSLVTALIAIAGARALGI